MDQHVARTVYNKLNTGRRRFGTYFLHVDLDVLLQVVPVEVEHQVVDEVEAVAHNDEWQLVCELGLLSENQQQRQRQLCVITSPVLTHSKIISLRFSHLTFYANRRVMGFLIPERLDKMVQSNKYLLACKTIIKRLKCIADSAGQCEKGLAALEA